MERINEIPRLQEGPDRQDRGDVGVNEQDADPCDNRQGGKAFIECREEADVSEGDSEIHDTQGQKRWDHKINSAPVEVGPYSHGYRDLNKAWKDCGRVLFQDSSNDQPKDCEDNRKSEKEDREKEDSRALAEDTTGNVAHGLAPIPDGNHQRTKIVDGSDQNGSKKYP